MAALYKFKGGTAAAAPTQSTGSTTPITPAAAPVISSIAPSSTAHNVDCNLSITGTGFDSGATVQVGSNSVTPSTPATPTSINVTIPAADISIAGSVPISVKNSDGQISNQQALTLT
jgi:cytoskeletal protein RodZ